MNLEEEVLSIEQQAASVVAEARRKAQGMLATLEERRRAMRAEITARIEQELAGAKAESAGKLREALAEIEREKAKGLEAIREAGRKEIPRLARQIAARLAGG